LFIYDAYNRHKTRKYFNIFISFIINLEYYFTTSLIENNITLLLFLKVDGYPREPWGSAGMEMKEEYFPKQGMETEMGNILDDGTRNGKVSSGQSSPR
jgi:hypothetical protein